VVVEKAARQQTRPGPMEERSAREEEKLQSKNDEWYTAPKWHSRYQRPCGKAGGRTVTLCNPSMVCADLALALVSIAVRQLPAPASIPTHTRGLTPCPDSPLVSSSSSVVRLQHPLVMVAHPVVAAVSRLTMLGRRVRGIRWKWGAASGEEAVSGTVAGEATRSRSGRGRGGHARS